MEKEKHIIKICKRCFGTRIYMHHNGKDVCGHCDGELFIEHTIEDVDNANKTFDAISVIENRCTTFDIENSFGRIQEYKLRDNVEYQLLLCEGKYKCDRMRDNKTCNQENCRLMNTLDCTAVGIEFDRMTHESVCKAAHDAGCDIDEF